MATVVAPNEIHESFITMVANRFVKNQIILFEPEAISCSWKAPRNMACPLKELLVSLKNPLMAYGIGELSATQTAAEMRELNKVLYGVKYPGRK